MASPTMEATLLLVVPLLLAAFFGLFALRPPAPMVYRCRRCQHEFRRAARLGYPDACPACGAADWTLPAGD